MSSRRRFLVIGAVVLVVVVAAVVAGTLLATGDDEGGGATTGVELAGADETRALLEGIPQDGTAIGAPDAPVTLVEFADLQCPFCAQWATDAFPDLVEEYVRPGKLRIEFRGLTFIGPDSEKALRAALSAGEQDKLWQTVELLYQNQGGENTGWVSDELLDAVATSAMLDAGPWRDGFDSDAVDEGISSRGRARRRPPASTPRRRSSSARPAARSSAWRCRASTPRVCGRRSSRRSRVDRGRLDDAGDPGDRGPGRPRRVPGLVVLAPVSGVARRGRDAVRRFLDGGELALAWVLALVATLGSLYFSEVADFIPCRLCWFQRIAMYPLALILFLAVIARDRRGAYYAVALPVVGAVISLWHLYIEANPEQESPACRIGAPCSTKWIDEFGYVTIPMLALTAFAAIATLLVLALRPPRSDG